jgi:diguanylate cyclase (GGDEF)-like protein
MQKSKIYLLITANAIVLCVILVLMMPAAGMQFYFITGFIMAMMILVPSVLVSRALGQLTKDVDDTELELTETKLELFSVKSRLSEVTTLDELTGCSNRKHFVDVLGQHKAMCERGSYDFTVVAMQVDQFSDIVEKHGLTRGNEVLQLFSRIVKAALREVDVLARFNTDKFAIILSGASEADALNIVNRISHLIAQIQVDGANEVKITSSGGVTSFHGTETLEDLVAHAEQAMEFAIVEGRDRVAGYNYIAPIADDEQAGGRDLKEKEGSSTVKDTSGSEIAMPPSDRNPGFDSSKSDRRK